MLHCLCFFDCLYVDNVRTSNVWFSLFVFVCLAFLVCSFAGPLIAGGTERLVNNELSERSMTSSFSLLLALSSLILICGAAVYVCVPRPPPSLLPGSLACCLLAMPFLPRTALSLPRLAISLHRLTDRYRLSTLEEKMKRHLVIIFSCLVLFYVTF